MKKYTVDYYMRDFGHVAHEHFHSREDAERAADKLLCANKISGYLLTEDGTFRLLELKGYCGI